MSQSGDSPAQPTVITGHDLDRNGTYTRRTVLDRLQGDLVYVDRLEGEIPLDGTVVDPQPEQRDRDELSVPEVSSRIVLFVFLAVLVAVLYRWRHLALDRIGALGRDAPVRAQKRAQPAGAVPAETQGFLDRIRTMENREQALVLLLEATLAAAARANGMRLGASETARDLVRRLPQDWPYLVPLRRLVLAEELVQFGGRPLHENVFETCLTEAAPILKADPQ